MNPIFGFFDGAHASLMAGVVAFVAFFCIARVAHARQGIALAFGLAPLLLILALEVATAAGAA